LPLDYLSSKLQRDERLTADLPEAFSVQLIHWSRRAREGRNSNGRNEWYAPAKAPIPEPPSRAPFQSPLPEPKPKSKPGTGASAGKQQQHMIKQLIQQL